MDINPKLQSLISGVDELTLQIEWTRDMVYLIELMLTDIKTKL
jgi:hypothetical protein